MVMIRPWVWSWTNRGVNLPSPYILYTYYIYFYIYKTIKPYRGVGLVDNQRLMKYGCFMVLNHIVLKPLKTNDLKPSTYPL